MELGTEKFFVFDCDVFVYIYQNHLSACIDRCRDTASSEDLSNEEELGRLSRSLGHALHLVGIATAWKKGSRIQDLSGFMEVRKGKG